MDPREFPPQDSWKLHRQLKSPSPNILQPTNLDPYQPRKRNTYPGTCIRADVTAVARISSLLEALRNHPRAKTSNQDAYPRPIAPIYLRTLPRRDLITFSHFSRMIHNFFNHFQTRIFADRSTAAEFRQCGKALALEKVSLSMLVL